MIKGILWGLILITLFLPRESIGENIYKWKSEDGSLHFSNYIPESIENTKEKIELLLEEKKKLEKETAGLRLNDKLGQLDHILALTSEVGNIKIYKGKVTADNMDELKSFGDEMRNKIESGVGVLVAQVDNKVGIVAVVSDDLIKSKKLSAGKIVGELAKLVGGGGGGRPHLATGGRHRPSPRGKRRAGCSPWRSPGRERASSRSSGSRFLLSPSHRWQ